MTKFASLLAAALALSTLAAPAALAHAYKAGDISIKHPWSRETAPRAKTGAGYLTIVNGGGEADRLIGGTSPVAERLEVHSVTMIDNIMRMRHQENGVEIPAGGTLELKPGGYHIMLIGLKAPLKAGESVPATLEFAKAGKVDVTFKVEALSGAAATPAPAASHGTHGETQHHGKH
ncbi:copper chaperone PCu(A)C [Pedomonas sp. V897]|uniref:copper chaperone PCu(A)C n=1 Tax=Pedomonas sp. V897 TaxID=3446482 RepID=UPI003EE26132